MLPCLLLGALTAVFATLYVAARRRNASLGRQLAALRVQGSNTRPALTDEMLATVSHELRTPLTSIRGALGLIAGGLNSPDPRAEKLIGIAVSNTDRLIRLINNLLDLEHMESGRAAIELRRCDLADLVREAVESLTAQAEAAQVKLQLEPALCFLSFPVQADSDRILQVLTNLLGNAIKFSPAGSVIRIDARAAQGALQLTIADEGRGIPADQLETIFQRFHQVELADARQKGGAGLGLAICRAIAHQHAGSIHATANQGSGATFHLHLPFPADAALPVLTTPQFEEIPAPAA